MTTAEYARVQKMLLGAWPSAKLDADALAYYAMELRALDYEETVAAIRAIGRTGEKFIPSAGSIVRKVAELAVDAPAWVDVVTQLRRLVKLGYGGIYTLENHGLARFNRVMNDETHPLVRDFAERIGGQGLRSHFDDGGNGEARLRHKWEGAVAERVDHLALSTLPERADAPRIERARREVGSGLRKLDPAQAAGLLPAAGEA